MNVRDFASEGSAAAVAAAVVGLFTLYFIVAALVPDLFGEWPRIGVGLGVGIAAGCFAGCFAARARASGPLPWRVADAAVAVLSALLLVQAVSFLADAPLAITADSLPIAFVHLVLWVGVLSTVVLVSAALRAIGVGLPEPAL